MVFSLLFSPPPFSEKHRSVPPARRLVSSETGQTATHRLAFLSHSSLVSERSRSCRRSRLEFISGCTSHVNNERAVWRLWKRASGPTDRGNGEFLRALAASFSNSAHYAPWWRECSGVFWHERGAVIAVKRRVRWMKRTLLQTANNAAGTNAEVSTAVFLPRSRGFEVRLGRIGSHVVFPYGGLECAALLPTNNTVLRRARHPGPLESRPKRVLFTSKRCVPAHVSLSPGPPFWNVNLSGVLLCFYYSLLCNR